MSPKIMLTAALASGLVLGCNQKKQTGNEENTGRQEGAARLSSPEKQTKEPRNEARASKTSEPKPFETGSSLTYLPKSCEISRMYLNARTLKKYGATAAELAPMLANAIARVPEARRTMTAALNGLRANGVDLADDVHELAGCVKAEDQWLGVLAVDLHEVAGKPLELMKNAAAKEMDLDLKLKQSHGVSYLAADEVPGALGMIDERTLAYASNADLFATAKQRLGSRRAFGADLGKTVLASRFDAGPIENGSLELSQSGDSTIATLKIDLYPDDAKRIKQDGGAYVASLDRWARQQGFDINDDALDKIAQMPDKASFSMKGDEVSAKIVMANDNLAGLLVALAGMTPEDLIQTLPKI